MDPTKRLEPFRRFNGLADIYARARPSYPEQAIDFVETHCGLTAGSLVIDVGCGTGISSRLFADRGMKVIGIEPNIEMLQRAKQETTPDALESIEFRTGYAENTGVAANEADLVLSAQAFHWFNPPSALKEFHRILKPGGWVVLMWNERDQSDEFTAAYGKTFRELTDAASVEIPRLAAGEPLLQSTLFEHRERRVFQNSQVVDEAGLLDRAFSASYAPRSGEGADKFRQALKNLFATFSHQGKVKIVYETSVYLAQKSCA